MSSNVRDTELARLDRAHLLHPITEFRVHEREGSTIFVRGKGLRLETADGRSMIDGLSGLMNVNVGHGRPEIAAAAAEQMQQLAYFPSFWQLSNEPAVRLATRLASLLPADREIERFVFSTGGSDANEMAFRIARLYHAVQGNTKRRKILSRRWAYHGITRSTGSATRLPAYHAFEELDPTHVETATPYCLRCEFGKTYPDCRLACAEDVEAVIEREGADTIAAMVAEPLLGTGGVILPPPDYFARLQEICRKHGILFLLDEVITGFGRTGKWFAMEHWDIRPDIVSMAKGITSGQLPLGAVGLSRRVYETIRDGLPEGMPFMMGFTYNNHPTSCAAALANIELLEREGLVENAATVGARMLARLREGLADQPVVAEVRGLGLIFAIEFAEPGTIEPVGGVPWAFAHAVNEECWKRGLITRAFWDSLGMGPPLCVTQDEGDTIVDIIIESVRAAAAAAGKA